MEKLQIPSWYEGTVIIIHSNFIHLKNVKQLMYDDIADKYSFIEIYKKWVNTMWGNKMMEALLLRRVAIKQ